MIARESLNLQTPYELPAGKLEELIAGIFAEVFELDRVGAADEWRGESSLSSPELAACTDGHCQQAEREIDRHDAADLPKLLGGFGEGFPFDGTAKAAPRRKEQMQEQQHHHDADGLHHVDMQWSAGEPAECAEQHHVAANQQKDDTRPHPREEAAEDPMPKGEPLGRLERPCGRTKHDVGEEHAAHPDDGGKHVERDEQCHAPRLSQDSALGVGGREAFLL